MSDCNKKEVLHPDNYIAPVWLRRLMMALILSVFGMLVPISVVQVTSGIAFSTGICLVFRYT